MLNKLQFINKVSWEDIFLVWENREGRMPSWQELAKEKGWTSWKDWRGYQADLIKAKNREWNLYKITDPNNTIPKFRMGPYKGWQEHYPEKNIHTFAELVFDHSEWVEANQGIVNKIKNFPPDTQFIGIYIIDKNAIVLFEGHHRAAAVALAKAKNTPITFSELPHIAMTTFSKEEEHLLDELLKNGTNNPNKI